LSRRGSGKRVVWSQKFETRLRFGSDISSSPAPAASTSNTRDEAVPAFVNAERSVIMGNLTRWDPIGEIARFDPFRDMNDYFKGFMLRPVFQGLEAEPEIKLEISEADKAYTVKADIPGVKKDDIQVSIDGNQISISAEVRHEKEEKEGKKLVRSERYYGKQFRSFTLAHDIDESKAEAEYNDGVLKLTLPKKAGAESKKITIK
jgi:HSP20 family protein